MHDDALTRGGTMGDSQSSRTAASDEGDPSGRRGFLRGLFGGVTAAGLVVAASRSEIAAFASPLVRDAPVVLGAPPPATVPAWGEYLFNAKGEAVAIVTGLAIVREHVDTTMFGEANRAFVAALPRAELRAEVIGSVEVADVRDFRPRLRGSKGPR